MDTPYTIEVIFHSLQKKYNYQHKNDRIADPFFNSSFPNSKIFFQIIVFDILTQNNNFSFY